MKFNFFKSYSAMYFDAATVHTATALTIYDEDLTEEDVQNDAVYNWDGNYM